MTTAEWIFAVGCLVASVVAVAISRTVRAIVLNVLTHPFQTTHITVSGRTVHVEHENPPGTSGAGA
jgi:urea transporter